MYIHPRRGKKTAKHKLNCRVSNDSHITLHSASNTLNISRPKRSRRYFVDDIFKCIFLNENAWILIKISLKFVPTGSINNIPALVEIMAWRRPGDKPLSEPMLVRILTHICVTRPQWVNVPICKPYQEVVTRRSQLTDWEPNKWWKVCK